MHLPMPGMGEHGVRGTAPCWTEADRADLSGGPPGAERGTRSVGKDTHASARTSQTRVTGGTNLTCTLPHRLAWPLESLHPRESLASRVGCPSAWVSGRRLAAGSLRGGGNLVTFQSQSADRFSISLGCHTLSWPGGHLRSDWSGLKLLHHNRKREGKEQKK